MTGLGMSALKVYLAVEPCDRRKGFNGLTVTVLKSTPCRWGLRGVC